MNTYLALTIGPITKTLQKAKNTQSLWGASYILSYLMKQICLDLKAKYANDFVIPYILNEEIFKSHEGAGLFPDRLIIKNGKIEDLQKAINSAIDNLVKNKTVEAINTEIENYNKLYKKTIDKTNADELKSFLYKYFLFGAVEVEVEKGKNVIDECGKMLSILELQTPYYSTEKTDLLYYLIQNISETGLIQDAFGMDVFRFPSLFEITTSEFNKGKYHEEYKRVIQESFKQKNDDNSLIKKLKAVDDLNTLFRRYHKYIAIVKADGDNMGNAVTAVFEKDASKVKDIDAAILKYNIKAVEKINAYGGNSIYLGGDDLLFFAPICSNENNVFLLVKDLSDLYNKTIGSVFTELQIQLDKIPTLSFGISITYYKYPMNEALSSANQLLENAKEGMKNAVSFRVMKHSGQFFGTRFRQDKEYYIDSFYKLINETKLENEDAFLSSVMYRIRELEDLVKVILKEENRKIRLENFFDNNFNEAIHSVKKVFLKIVAEYINQTFSDTNSETDLTLETVYSTLRLIQFLHQKDTDNDN